MDHTLHITAPVLDEDVPVAVGTLADLGPLAQRLLAAGIGARVCISQGTPSSLTGRQKLAQEVVLALLEYRERQSG